MTEQRLICTVAIELSRARWVIGALPPRGAKVSVGGVTGGDTERLMEYLNKIEARLMREFCQPVELKICFEAGYDGFWLARFLRDRRLDVYVLDASSFLISRRGRRTKTDRIDVETMAFTLRAYLAGDPGVCRVVAIPTPEVEDAKRISRERTRLASERTRHVNRIRGLLSLHGIKVRVSTGRIDGASAPSCSWVAPHSIPEVVNEIMVRRVRAATGYKWMRPGWRMDSDGRCSS